MTRDETKKLLSVIYNSYPNWKPNDLVSVINSWYFIMEEYDFKEIGIALKTYMKSNTSGFAPSVSQLIQLLPSTLADESSNLSDAEAWSIVRKAISRSSYYAEEEFLKLPETIQVAVGSPSNLRKLATTEDFNEEVESSNFKRTYRTVLARNSEVKRMPKEVQQLISASTARKNEKYGVGATNVTVPLIETIRSEEDIVKTSMNEKARNFFNDYINGIERKE